MRSMRKRAVVGVLAASALGLGGITAIGLGATTTKSIQAKDPLAYSVKTLTVPAGKLTIKMVNKGSIPHDIAIKGKGIKTVKGKVVPKGGSTSVTATLKKGKYTFYCTVPGHEQAGMKGTLKVT